MKYQWLRGGLLYLAASFLVVGLWATFDPAGFYEDFPGGGRQWIAGDGPYNAHLTGDAGVGFLAVGVVLLLGAVWICSSPSAIRTRASVVSTRWPATGRSPSGPCSLSHYWWP